MLQGVALLILAAGCTLSLAALISLLAEGDSCLGIWRVTPSCRQALAGIREPSRMDLELTLLAAAAAAVSACLAFARGHAPRSWLDCLLVAGFTAGVGAALDPDLRGAWPVLLTTMLLFPVALGTQRSLQIAGFVAAGTDANAVSVARRALSTRLLLVAAGNFVLAGFLAEFAGWPELTAVHKGWFAWDAVVVTLDVVGVLMYLRWAENRASWRALEVRVDRGVAPRTLHLGALLVASAAVVAFVIPVFSVLAILLEPVGVLGRLVVGLFSHLPYKPPVYGAARHNGWLFFTGGSKAPRGKYHHHVHHAVHAAVHSTSWLVWGTHILVWGIVLAAVGILLYGWRRLVREGREAELPGAVRFLLRLWRGLRRRTHAVTQGLGHRLPAGLADLGSGLPHRLGVGEARLPRERIQRYYLGVLAEASRQGIPRPPGRTPSRFQVQLEPFVPEAERALQDLTALFLIARYAPLPVTAEDATAASRCWRALRRAARRSARNPRPSREPHN